MANWQAYRKCKLIIRNIHDLAETVEVVLRLCDRNRWLVQITIALFTA